MGNRISVNGRVKKRYFFRCDTCERYSVIKEFSARWKPNKTRYCPECLEPLRTCRPVEAKEASKLFPRKAKRRGDRHWYYEYLASPEWAIIRNRILERDSARCYGCGKTATQVHHRSYRPEVIAGYADDQLVSLCHHCHRHIEFDGNRKVCLREANERLADMAGR